MRAQAEKNEELLRAIFDNNEGRVQTLLDEGAQPLAVVAYQREKLSLVEMLKTDNFSPSETTPFSEAIKTGRFRQLWPRMLSSEFYTTEGIVLTLRQAVAVDDTDLERQCFQKPNWDLKRLDYIKMLTGLCLLSHAVLVTKNIDMVRLLMDFGTDPLSMEERGILEQNGFRINFISCLSLSSNVLGIMIHFIITDNNETMGLEIVNHQKFKWDSSYAYCGAGIIWECLEKKFYLLAEALLKKRLAANCSFRPECSGLSEAEKSQDDRAKNLVIEYTVYNKLYQLITQKEEAKSLVIINHWDFVLPSEDVAHLLIKTALKEKLYVCVEALLKSWQAENGTFNIYFDSVELQLTEIEKDPREINLLIQYSESLRNRFYHLISEGEEKTSLAIMNHKNFVCPSENVAREMMEKFLQRNLRACALALAKKGRLSGFELVVEKDSVVPHENKVVENPLAADHTEPKQTNLYPAGEHLAPERAVVEIAQTHEDEPVLSEQKDGDNQALLPSTTENIHSDAVVSLSRQDTNLNITINRPGHEDHGKTALCCAIESDHVQVVTALERQQCRAIRLAAQEGQLNLVRELVEREPALVEHKDINGHTPLQLALMNGQIEVANYLVDNSFGRLDYEKTLCFAAKQLGWMKLLIKMQLSNYILERGDEKQPEHKSFLMFGLYKRNFGFSKQEKLKAANALKSVMVDGADQSILKRYKKELNNGELGSIYRRFCAREECKISKQNNKMG